MSSEQIPEPIAAPDDEVAQLTRAANDFVAGEPGNDRARSSLVKHWSAAFILATIAASAVTLYVVFRPPAAAPDLTNGRAQKQPTAPPDPQPGERRVAVPPPDQLPLDPILPGTGEGLIAECHRVVRDLTDRFPRNPDAHEMRARFEFEFASPDEAQAAWERCLALDSNYVYAHVGLAKAATQRGQLAQAVAHMRRAVLAEPASIAHQIELGKALLAAGEIEEALTVLEGTVRVEPANPLAHAVLGSAQLQNRDDAAARKSFEKALALDADDAAAHFGLATALERLGAADQTREHQVRHAELSSRKREVVRGERIAYDDERSLKEDIARLYAEIGSVYLAENRSAAAEQLWRRAARLDAENRQSRQALAWLSVQQHKPLESILQLRELARLEPENVAYPAEIARLFGEMGRLDDAERTLQEFAQAAPDSAGAQRALAEFYLGVLNEPGTAVEHAQKAAEISGAATEWVLLSAAHERAGDLPAAVAALERATGLAPENLQYRQLLALLRERASAHRDLNNAPKGAKKTNDDR